jgi:hypothetical protein
MTPPTPLRRTTDHGDYTTLAGFVFILVAVGLRVLGYIGEWSMLTVAVLAAVLIRGESVLGFVRVWRRKP